MKALERKLFIHQEAMLRAVYEHPKIPYFFLVGGYGCLLGSQPIETPFGEIPIKYFKGGPVYSLLATGRICEQIAFPAVSFPHTHLFQVGEVVGTCYHRMLSSSGSYLPLGVYLYRDCVTWLSLHQSTEVFSNEALLQDARRLTKIALGLLVRYLCDFHLCDEQLHQALDNDLALLPLQDDARAHRSYDLREYSDDREHRQLYSHLHQVFDHLCMLDYTFRQDFPSEDEVFAGAQGCAEYTLLSLLNLLLSRVMSSSEDLAPLLSHNQQFFSTYSLQNQSIPYKEDNVKCSYYGKDEYWDLEVYKTHNYISNGYVHHNCGKSTTGVYLILQIISNYQGHRVNVLIGGVSIKLLRETLLADLFVCFAEAGIRYKHSPQAGIITVGTITIIYINISDPANVFAINSSVVILDEIDEIPAERVKMIITAVQERNRIVLPKTARLAEREPYVCSLTTAQGMRGTFLLLEDFKKSGMGYVKIRGLTKDNTVLAKSQYENLYRLYTPEERKAFLDGEFVNLSAGRVYSEYDERVNMYMNFSVSPSDTIFAGQDFNYGYNACICMIERGGVIYAVSEHHWDVLGDAPRQLRKLYPDNKIVFIPDSSGKEIMEGWQGSFDEEKIECVWYGHNPSISERILAVNKLLRLRRYYLFTTLSTLHLAYKTRDFDNAGKPRKSQGKGGVDHAADGSEYAVWHIIHTINGFEDILAVLRQVGSNSRYRNEPNDVLLDSYADTAVKVRLGDLTSGVTEIECLREERRKLYEELGLA